MLGIVHSTLVTGSFYCLLATSFYLIFSTSRIMHFAHGSVAIAGAYVGYAVVHQGGGLVLGFVAGTAAAAVVGALCDVGVYRPLRARGVPTTSLLIASLAIFVLLENVTAMIFGSAAVSVHSSATQPIGGTGDLVLNPLEIVSIVATLAWVIGMAAVMRRTRLGLFMRSVADHGELAGLTGVPVAQVRTQMFLVASAVAGFAGVSHLLDVGATPAVSIQATLFAIVPFIVGGQRSLVGSAITSYAVAFGAAIFSRYAGSEWSLSFIFGILALVVLFRPQGLAAPRVAAVPEGSR